MKFTASEYVDRRCVCGHPAWAHVRANEVCALCSNAKPIPFVIVPGRNCPGFVTPEENAAPAPAVV